MTPPASRPTPSSGDLITETSSPAGWWNQRGVAIWDRSVWPDRDGNCRAGRTACITSVTAMRAAQEKGQASVDVPSNVYFYLSVHPQVR